MMHALEAASIIVVRLIVRYEHRFKHRFKR